MEAVIKCDQGYESFDSMSACGSERKSSLSDTEFDPPSDDDDDEYSEPGVDDGIILSLSEKLKDGMSLVSRKPMRNSESVRESRRESAQPWSVQTQNSVTPSGGRLLRTTDTNDTYTRQTNNNNNSFTNIFSSQNGLTTSPNITNVMPTNLQRNNNLTYNNLIGQNIAGNNFISKNLASYHQTANTNLPTINNNTINNNLGYSSHPLNIFEQTPSSASSDEINEDILLDFPELEEYARMLEDDNGLGCIRYLFPDILPELSASDVSEGLGHIDQNIDFGKISPVSFTSTIVPPSVDSYPPSPIADDLLAVLSSSEQDSQSVVPDILSLPQHGDISTLLAESSGILDILHAPGQTSNVSSAGQTLNIPSSASSTPHTLNVPSTVSSSAGQTLNVSSNVSSAPHTLNVPTTIVTKYTSVHSDNYTSSSNSFLNIRDQRHSDTYTSSSAQTLNVRKYTSVHSDSEYSNSFLNIRDQRVSLSTNSTPSHPGSVEYSPLSSAESQSSPYSNSSSNDLELYQQQYSPNIIPVTVNDDLGEDDASRASSRQENVSAKERLYQKITADVMLKRAKDSAWFEACKTKQDKLVIMIQKLCKSSDKYVEAKLYANVQVYLDNASQDEVLQLFKSVAFLQHGSIVNNPVLTGYIREIMFNHGLE